MFLVIGCYMIAEWRMKIEVEEFLNNKVPDHIDFSYEQLEINLLKGRLKFDNIEVFSLGRQTSSCEIRVHADQLAIDGFSYWKIFLEKSIYLQTLTLSKPHLNFKTCPRDTVTNANAAEPINLLKPIFIEELVFESGMVEIWNADNEIELLSVQSINLSLKDVATDPEMIVAYVPFEFSDYAITIKELEAPLGEFEVLQMGTMELNNASIRTTDVSLATSLSKSELSKKLAFERDHINLSIPDILVKNHSYSIKHDTLQVFYQTLSVNAPKLEMYRDKAINDNYERRPLYSEMLRELPFKISIDSISINKATVLYEEDAPNDTQAGILSFENLDAKCTNLSNLVSNKENVTIRLNANLMGTGTFNLDWEFNIQDPSEKFKISGGLSNFDTSSLNDFLVPNLRTKTIGTIDQLYFTITGDEHVASGNIKMSYEDFKFQVLNKKRNHVKKLVSFIGNLFVSDGSRADENGYRYGTISTERPKNKSFFNYLWVNLEDGLLDVLTSNGKKE